MSSVSRRQIKNRPKTYVPPQSRSINPVMFVSEPITGPPMVGGNLKAVGRALKKGVKPVARVVRQAAKPAAAIASFGADVAELVPDPRAQALSKGLRTAAKAAPLVERVAKQAGGRRRRIPAAVGTVSVGGGRGKKVMMMPVLKKR